jgi:DNA gyrase/topoisomerase IV subunit A
MSILKKDKPTKLAELQEELENWESELANIQQGVPMQVTLNKLKQVDIPGIVKELATLEKELEEATTEANSQSAKLGDAKIALKTLQALKQQAGTISVASQKRDTALQYAQGIEEALGAGGSFKTLEEVQAELSGIQTKQYVFVISLPSHGSN